MRVMHVTDSFPPYGFGGTKYYLRDLVQEQSRRHHVSVVFRRRQSSDKEIVSREQGNYTLHELNFQRGKPDVFSAQGQALFSRLLAREKPDVLHFHSFRELPYSLIDVANANGIPCVYTMHDFSLICPALSLAKPDHALCSGHVSGFECFDCHTGHQGLSRVEQAKQLPLMPRYLAYQKQGVEALRKFDLLLCPTDFTAKKLSEFGLSRERMQTVRFGRTLSPRMRFKSIGEVMRFGFIGGLAPDKGIELLLRAFREVKRPDAQLDVYGNGEKDYEAYLVSLAGQAPINFLGTFDRTYIDRVFEHLDVFILPTLAQETTSLVLLEAIACGVPVIVPDAGGLPEIVKHYNAGLVFEYNDAGSLAEKIESCAENPQMVEQLSRQMPPIPSLEAHARELEEVYAGLLRK